MGNENDPSNPNRREILRRTSAGVAGVGLLGTFAGRGSAAPSTGDLTDFDVDREAAAAIEEFSSPSAIDEALETHSLGALRGLTDLDGLADTDAPAFSEMDPSGVMEFMDYEADVRVGSQFEQRGLSAELHYSKSWSDVDLSLTVLPQFREALAVVDYGDRMTVVEDVGDGDYERADYLLFEDDETLRRSMDGIDSEDAEVDGGCVAGAACRYFYSTYDENTDLYCCYDAQATCYDCYWGSFNHYCTSECDVYDGDPDYNSCSNDCYCGNC